MTDEYINTTIASHNGYTDIKSGFGWVKTSNEEIIKKVPDYCNDLNAMRVAELTLTEENKLKYASYLAQVFNASYKKAWWDLNAKETFEVINVSAKQKAEAYLKTLDKWEEHPQIN